MLLNNKKNWKILKRDSTVNFPSDNLSQVDGISSLTVQKSTNCNKECALWTKLSSSISDLFRVLGIQFGSKILCLIHLWTKLSKSLSDLFRIIGIQFCSILKILCPIHFHGFSRGSLWGRTNILLILLLKN